MTKTSLKRRILAIKAKRENRTRKSRFWAFVMFFPLAFIWLEAILHISCGVKFSWGGLLNILLFSLSYGIAMMLLSGFFSEKTNRVVGIVIISLLTLLFMIQAVYYQIFGAFLVLYSVQGAGNALGLGFGIMLKGIWSKLPTLIFMALPLIVFIVSGKKLFSTKKHVWPIRLISFGISLFFYLLATLIITTSQNSYWYMSTFDAAKSVELFGSATAARLDIKQLIFGSSDNVLDDDSIYELPKVEISIPADESSQGNTGAGESENSEESSEAEIPYVIRDQVVDGLSFASFAENEANQTIKSLHSYFGQITPTKTNKYTGRFEGKNLIYLTAEAFSAYAFNLAPELTPNLNRLYNEGFRFDNFYTPGWGVSTIDGEYINLTGLIPKSGVWSLKESAKNYLPYTYAQVFSDLEYEKVLAYHNHTYSYYDRQISHPALGYDYTGVGNGLQLERITWPNSDYQMMVSTVDDYINSDSFHVYYMTVSGHGDYTWGSNFIASKNKELVMHLPYSDSVKAYIACNIELDRAIGYLLERLEQAGRLEDTVIALSADHYPYGLDTYNGLDDIKGYAVEQTFERYENSLLIWCGDMEEPVEVNKVGSSLDILPTMLNLFGYEYDSRLLMGSDLLSDAEPLVVFVDLSWISAYGKYDAGKGVFTPFGDYTLPDNYVDAVKSVVSGKFRASRMILENNYYRKLFDLIE